MFVWLNRLFILNFCISSDDNIMFCSSNDSIFNQLKNWLIRKYNITRL